MTLMIIGFLLNDSEDAWRERCAESSPFNTEENSIPYRPPINTKSQVDTQ
jgi:hypothetical protein